VNSPSKFWVQTVIGARVKHGTWHSAVFIRDVTCGDVLAQRLVQRYLRDVRDISASAPRAGDAATAENKGFRDSVNAQNCGHGSATSQG